MKLCFTGKSSYISASTKGQEERRRDSENKYTGSCNKALGYCRTHNSESRHLFHIAAKPNISGI